MDWDIALEGQLPHAVGVAIKADAAEQPVATGRSERRQAEKAARRKASTQKRAARLEPPVTDGPADSCLAVL